MTQLLMESKTMQQNLMPETFILIWDDCQAELKFYRLPFLKFHHLLALDNKYCNADNTQQEDDILAELEGELHDGLWDEYQLQRPIKANAGELIITLGFLP